jgi:hypothetical protein
MLKVSADKAGKKVRCVKCGSIMTIPESGDETEQIRPAAPAQVPKAAPPPVPEDDTDFAPGPAPRRGSRAEEGEVDEPPRRRGRAVLDEDDDVARPRRRRRTREDDEDDDEGLSLKPPQAPPTAIVTVVGVLNLLLAGIIVAVSVYVMIAGAAFIDMVTGVAEDAIAQHPLPKEDPQAKQVVQQGKAALRRFADMGTILFILAGSCAIVLGGVPLLLAGIGVLKRRQWGRVLALILAALAVAGALDYAYQQWPISRFRYGWAFFAVLLSYGLSTFILLLIPKFGREFR